MILTFLTNKLIVVILIMLCVVIFGASVLLFLTIYDHIKKRIEEKQNKIFTKYKNKIETPEKNNKR